MKDSIIIRFLYQTVIGRFFLRMLISPSLSKVAAHYLKSSFSRWLVPVFVKINHIDLRCFKVPQGGYRSFNDFFTRPMKEKYFPKSFEEVVCPCDGLLTVSEINEDSVFHIKHTEYSVESLLKSSELAKEYQGGTAFIFRLTPAHYHRYIWAVSGTVCARKRISGVLHSVQPVCHEKTKVFVQNSREYYLVKSAEYGKVLQMEVGALLVGKIRNHELGNKRAVSVGQEKGFFEYGGSSIVVLMKDRLSLAREMKTRAKQGDEIPVVLGEKLIQQRKS